MKTAIYYFSATGNCLTTARILAQELSADLIPLAKCKGNSPIEVPYERIGFVFPIYYGDMPYLVRERISRMRFSAPDPYIFAFSTWRGHMGDIAKRLDDLLSRRNVCLSLSTGIPMPGNSYLSTEEQVQEALSQQQQHISERLSDILSRKTEDYHSLPPVKDSPVSFPSNMRGITADEKCTGCGICVKVCPMQNITVQNGHAAIGDNCQTCLACFHWCPSEAIWMSKEEKIARRSKYHHPDITLTDILNEK